MSRDVARLDVTAHEDTLCYSIPAAEVQDLISRHREVADYFLRTSVTRYMERSLNELRTQTNLMGNAEQLLYSLSVRDVVREPAVVCQEVTTIREAAQLAASAHTSSLFVVAGDRCAIGIVTDADFTQKVIARGVPVAGDFSLFERLAAHNHERLKGASFFKSVLGCISVTVKPPLGFFRTFVLERSGEHKEQLDLKSFGTSPIVNAARLFALDAGVQHSNTVDRLSALQSLGYVDAALLLELQEAFEFLTLMQLDNQLQQASAGEPLSNYISPGKLTHLQRNSLKEAFHAIARAHSVIDAKFRTSVWSQLGQ